MQLAKRGDEHGVERFTRRTRRFPTKRRLIGESGAIELGCGRVYDGLGRVRRLPGG
jgi:hypothetical protein